VIALATCRRLPEPDHDEAPLLRELRRLGVDARLAAWDDPAVDWSAFDACVIRSTWNYVHRLPEFLAWAKRAAKATRLVNPLPLVRWNADKRYFADLSRRGVRVVPTVFVSRGSRRRLAELGWNDLVIKPRVGAASFMTRRFRGGTKKAEEFLRAAAEERDMMVQPYVPSVETRGERSLVWIDGALTHSVRKSPRLAGGAEEVSAAKAISPEERRFAAKALAPYRSKILYARVDVAQGEDGGLMLMELELIEPSLFLVQSRAALRRLARAISRL
jgi:glutathione synthase/RimK-type ligase-like ATP-grasp enzyme